jgi:hypothetical protein
VAEPPARAAAGVGDRESCLVSLSRPGLAWHLVIGGNNTYGLV